MLQAWVVIAVALAYIGLLFLVASYGDQTRGLGRGVAPGLGREGRTRLLIYPLSLAIYCTSWTFFGSVGSASRTGYEFLAIYIGPMLMIGPVLAAAGADRAAGQDAEQHLDRRLHRRALRQGPSGRRYCRADRDRRHHSLHRAAAQSSIVSLSTILAHITPIADVTHPLLGDIALFVALSMATFAVLFGTRHIDATEHQDGLMLAIAAESIVKLFAFLAVGIFVTFWIFDGPGALFEAARRHSQSASIFTREPPFATLSSPRCCRSWRSFCCRGNSMWRWWRTTTKPRSSAPLGCFRSIWC